jgi:hypothetical protein
MASIFTDSKALSIFCANETKSVLTDRQTCGWTDVQIVRQTDSRQEDRWTDAWKDRQAARNADSQTGRWITRQL